MFPLALFYLVSSLSLSPFLFRYLQYTGSGFGKLVRHNIGRTRLFYSGIAIAVGILA